MVGRSPRNVNRLVISPSCLLNVQRSMYLRGEKSSVVEGGHLKTEGSEGKY
jgi:hypothetical protein